MAKDLCSSSMPNGGAPECDRSRGIPRYVIISSKKFTKAEYASLLLFKNAFKAAALKSRDESDKLIVLPIALNVEKATEAKKTGTLNQGKSEILMEGIPAFNLQVKMSYRQSQILRSLNGLDLRIFVVDHVKAFWGELNDAEDLQGNQAQVYISGDDFTDGQSIKTVEISVSFTDVEAFKSAGAYLDLNFNVADYGRLKDVTLYEKIAAAANVINISGMIKTGKAGGGLDIYEDYKAAMAIGGNWTAKNLQTGLAMTITSVAQNAGGYWVFTLDATQWGALQSADQVEIKWAAPSVLDAANVTGVESVALVISKP